MSQKQTSAKGVEFIKSWEGPVPYKVKGKNGKPSGNWTVGYGHEITDEQYKSKKFHNLTKDEATKLLAKDLNAAESSVLRVY